MAVDHKEFKIAYVGRDDQFWKNIKSKVEEIYAHSDRRTKVSIIDNAYNDDDDPILVATFRKIYLTKPDIVYVDFSLRPKAAYNLVKLLRRCNRTQKICVCGLVDLIHKDTVLRLTTLAGCHFSFVKGGELHDIIYDAFTFSYPNEVQEPNFARASFVENVEVFLDMRVSTITKDSIIVESDFAWKKGEVLDLNWPIDEIILPSKKFVVKSVDTTNLYHHYQHSIELQYKYADPMVMKKQKEMIFQLDDPFLPKNSFRRSELEAASELDEDEVSDCLVLVDEDEDDSASKSLQIVDENEGGDDGAELDLEIKGKRPPTKELVNVLRDRLYNWINRYPHQAPQKATKVLIIDKSMNSALALKKSVSEYFFSLRMQGHLNEVEEELMYYRPNIISFEYEPLPNERDPNADPLNWNNIESLKSIVDFVKGQYNYHPFVLIFNNPTYNNQSCRDAFEYAQIFVNPGKTNIKMIEQMAEVHKKNYQKKTLSLARKKAKTLREQNPDRYEKLKDSDLIEVKLLPSKDDVLSEAKVPFKIQLISMTESEVSFISEKKFVLNSVIKMTIPVEMLVTIVPQKAASPGSQIKNCYRGLIHSIGEHEKQKLRRFVNSVFVKTRDMNRELDRKEIEELKEKFLHDDDQAEDESDISA